MDFRKSVKIGLIEKEMTYEKLAEKVRERTGMYCDTALLSRVINGKVNSPRIAEAIGKILELCG